MISVEGGVARMVARRSEMPARLTFRFDHVERATAAKLVPVATHLLSNYVVDLPGNIV